MGKARRIGKSVGRPREFVMRTCRLFAVMAIGLALASAGGRGGLAAPSMSLQRDGSLEIGGRKLRCGPVRIMLPRRLNNLGVAGPGMIALNPRLLASYPEIVRLFVFAHECGHHHVGGSELGADCWAVRRGVREGWLDRNGLDQVCRSISDEPASSTHPSGRRRCGNLDRCFASAIAALPKPPGATAGAGTSAVARAGDTAPRLLVQPTLVRTGRVRSAEPNPAPVRNKDHGFNAGPDGRPMSRALTNGPATSVAERGEEQR
jgi:hypothetical protein